MDEGRLDISHMCCWTCSGLCGCWADSFPYLWHGLSQWTENWIFCFKKYTDTATCQNQFSKSVICDP